MFISLVLRLIFGWNSHKLNNHREEFVVVYHNKSSTMCRYWVYMQKLTYFGMSKAYEQHYNGFEIAGVFFYCLRIYPLRLFNGICIANINVVRELTGCHSYYYICSAISHHTGIRSTKGSLIFYFFYVEQNTDHFEINTHVVRLPIISRSLSYK